jgi:hypothetical protein
MSELDSLINDADPIISGAAARVKKLKDELDAGRLTHAEYDELVQDTLTLSKVQKLMVTLDQKELVKQAFEKIMVIIGMAKSLL